MLILESTRASAYGICQYKKDLLNFEGSNKKVNSEKQQRIHTEKLQ